MKRTTILGICITAFVAIAAWAPNVLAYTGNANCTGCHNWFAANSSHDRHQNRGISCSLCHNNNTANSCGTCHGGGAAIQTRHIDNYGEASCEGCHPQAPPPPVAETNCSDGIDNNNNGLTDCADPDCDGFVGQATTCGVGACEASGNQVCQTPGQVNTCQPGAPAAEGPFNLANCGDGIDNDCDGFTDANDPDCETPAEICNDGNDNNLNGLTDCEDPQCADATFGACDTGNSGVCAGGTLICDRNQPTPVCNQNQSAVAEGPFTNPNCNDGLDNDCNGSTDASDPNCAIPTEICDDGVDNNGNGQVDCQDPDCVGVTFGACNTGNPGVCADGTSTCDGSQTNPVCNQDQPAGNEGPYGNASCGDTIDNDCNGLTDAADPNCQPGVENCNNNVDDNNDGLVDCLDPQCETFVGQPGSCTTGLPGICSAGTPACNLGEKFCDQDTQAGTEGPDSLTCNDGLDNDCDGLTDQDDAECTPPPTPSCGDGNIDAGEECDDGNTVDGDGCSSTCQNETTPPPTGPVCGDGIVDAGEQCDDGNTTNGDGCENNCTETVTGGCNEVDLPVITRMDYDRDDEELKIEGRAPAGTTISIIDSDSGEILAEGIRVREGRWETEIDDIESDVNVSVISSNGCAANQDVETDDEHDDEHHEERDSHHRSWRYRSHD